MLSGPTPTMPDSDYEPDADDAVHIQRLQELRQLGTHNMFTEVKDGLIELFGDDGRETYQWVQDHFEYYETGNWRDVDPVALEGDD